MRSISIFLALAIPSLAKAAPAPVQPRNGKDDPLTVEFWKDGCGIYESGGFSTFLVSSDGNDQHPGDCFRAPEYNFKNIQITQDSAASYSIDVFNGEACDGLILTTTNDGCYTAPEGMMVLSARANLK